MNYMGIDHHRQYSHITWLDENGEVVRQRAFYIGKQTAVKNRLRALLKTYRHVEERISETNALVDELDEKIPSARLLQTVPGFGKFLAVLVAVEMGGVERFEEVGKFHAYAGVIYSTYSSGERSFDGKIIKVGNCWLRWVAAEAVWPALRADFDLRCYYERMKTKKGSNSAKVATARRLLTIIYRMLKENRSYIPHKR